MEYTLMHKNIRVAGLDIDNATGNILKVYALYSEAHLPVGVAVKRGAADRAALNEWCFAYAPSRRTKKGLFSKKRAFNRKKGPFLYARAPNQKRAFFSRKGPLMPKKGL